MIDAIDFDPALVGLWPPGGAGTAPYGADAALERAVPAVLLETKAAAEPPAAGELLRLLNDMTAEMREQFDLFRRIRVEAEAKIAGSDDAEQKLAKSDLKSASDALSLIVRTLEKIDSLQRSLAHDLETAAEQQFGLAEYEAMLADIDRRIDARAEERMHAWLAERGLAEDNGTGPPEPG